MARKQNRAAVRGAINAPTHVRYYKKYNILQLAIAVEDD